MAPSRIPRLSTASTQTSITDNSRDVLDRVVVCMSNREELPSRKPFLDYYAMFSSQTTDDQFGTGLHNMLETESKVRSMKRFAT